MVIIVMIMMMIMKMIMIVIVIIMMMIIEMKHRGGRVKLAHIIVSSTSTVENLLWHFLLNLGSAFCLQI